MKAKGLEIVDRRWYWRRMVVEQPRSSTTNHRGCPMITVLLRTFHRSGQWPTVSLPPASHSRVGNRRRHRGQSPESCTGWIRRQTEVSSLDISHCARVCAERGERGNEQWGARQRSIRANVANEHCTGHRLAATTVVRAKRYLHSWLFSPNLVTL